MEKKILIAEDSETNQMVIEMLLEDLDIENITMVNNGIEAFEEYKTNYDEYNLILMDINMPIMGGIESTSKILDFEKSNNIKHIPIIALTASTAEEEKKEFLENGLDGYLAKPIKEAELVEILDKCLI